MNKFSRNAKKDKDVDIPLKGRDVTRSFVDDAFGLEFWEPNDLVTIRIGGRFLLKVGGADYSLSPEEPATLGPAFTLIRKRVEAAKASKDGSLEMKFADESTLKVAPDPNYEAWEIAGSNGFRVVSMPGGGLAVWSAES